VTSGGNILKYFRSRWFIKISLVDTTEMREILVTRRVSGTWL